MQKKDELKRILDASRRIVFFGGAGVSAASGIPDFRSDSGLYARDFEGLDPEMILSVSFFYLDPETFFRFYRQMLLHPEAKPNSCHRYLYTLEKEDRLRGIVTQNVDGLHQAAGNIRVYELHGSVHENVCMDCGERYDMMWMLHSAGIPRCERCGGVVKPGIVLYGESLNPYTCMGADREISQCDTLLIAGTSLQVEPAASFLRSFRGSHLLVINRDATPADDMAELVLREDLEQVMSFLEKN